MPDLGDLDCYWMLDEALDWLRSVDSTLVDRAALDKLSELCRLHDVRSIALRCEPSFRPYLRMGRPIEGFEPIPAHDWADLHFGFDEGDQVVTDDLHSITFKRRMWTGVQFLKGDLTRALAVPSDMAADTEDNRKLSAPARPPTRAVAEMAATLLDLQHEGQVKRETTKKEQHRLVLKRLSKEKDTPRGYGYETFRTKVLYSS
jgi:hypothetical protein